MSQSSGIDEVVEAIDRFRIPSGRPDAFLISTLEPRAFLNCECTINKG